MTVDRDNWDNHGWSWSHGLHIMEAEFVRDDEYVAA
jgi:hypothetical protein